MTYEYASYYKLMLLCGYTDELISHVNRALNEQEPISDIILDLGFAGENPKKLLSALNAYLGQIKFSDIDYDGTVFNLVMDFLKRKYVDESMSRKDMTKLMYRFATHTEQYLAGEIMDDPWYTMYFLDDLLYDAEHGYISKQSFECAFDDYLNKKKPIT